MSVTRPALEQDVSGEPRGRRGGGAEAVLEQTGKGFSDHPEIQAGSCSFQVPFLALEAEVRLDGL